MIVVHPDQRNFFVRHDSPRVCKLIMVYFRSHMIMTIIMNKYGL